MGKVFSHMTMSLDGYIAQPDDQVGELFDWYEAGDVVVPNPNEDISVKVDEAGAKAWRDLTENTGAPIAGRRLFDIAGDRNVTIARANVTQQALALGLVDEVCVSLARR
ncbi:hypothetical protein [Nonomuraea ceibae]|uniref:hypothetical protein n=1 Tax=Nonomuraea ceibae TaxID=1935170 RepID=UPI001C5DBC54|nr:hypothetical protein [Nonomuraea ceibae]